MKEKTVVKNILDALNKHYPGFYYKTHGGLYQKVGLPDIIGLHKGRFIGIEVKAPGREKNLTEKQSQVITKIQLAGGIAFMESTVEGTLQKMKMEVIKDEPRAKRTKDPKTR